MRLFIGISPTAEVSKSLVRMQSFLQRHGITGAYLTPENLHMTLAFIGEYPEIDPVMDALEEVPFSSFPIIYTHIGTFRESIVWGGIEPSAQLNTLVKRLRRQLATVDIPFDNGTFSPHFTIARHANFSKGIPQIEIEPVTMNVDRITLYRSDREKNGMIYTEVGYMEATPSV